MERRDLDELNRRAACRGAEPRLFDAVEPRAALVGLSFCAHCEVVALCKKVLRPGRTHYDGVAAAAVYRNGRIVASLARDSHTRQLVSTIERSHP